MKKHLSIFFLFPAIIVVVVIGFYIYIEKANYNKNIANLEPKEFTDYEASQKNPIRENAYIDIWRDNSMDIDLAVHSIGTGIDKKLYLGTQPLHYLINKNGEVHTYQDSCYQSQSGQRDPATIKYIKTLSQSELENLENDLKSIIESSNSGNSSYWYIKINGNSIKVNVNLQETILNNYL